MARILAVDWGERRVGLAISDPSATLARALPTLSTRSEKETVTAVGAVARDEEVDEPADCPSRFMNTADSSPRSCRHHSMAGIDQSDLPIPVVQPAEMARDAEDLSHRVLIFSFSRCLQIRGQCGGGVTVETHRICIRDALLPFLCAMETSKHNHGEAQGIGSDFIDDFQRIDGIP